MTREEFMDIVYSELHSDGDNYRANRIIDAADEYAEEQSRWISCRDKLPEDDDDVLVWDGYNNMVAWYMDDEWHSLDKCFKSSCPIKYWMTLPEEPEPKEGE